MLRERNGHLDRRVGTLKEQLDEYRVKSNKMTEFIYGLRVNNIDVDELYKRMSHKNSRQGLGMQC